MRCAANLLIILIVISLGKLVADPVQSEGALPRPTQIYVDMDGDGIDDLATDGDGNGIPDEIQANESPVAQPGKLKIADVFADVAVSAKPVLLRSCAQRFGYRKQAIKGMLENRWELGAGFGLGNSFGTGVASGGGACAGGICGPG